jgi:hypothetical protein
MKITYQNIANFSLGDPSNLFQFFVEQKEGEDPFGIYIPKEHSFFSDDNILNWLDQMVLTDSIRAYFGDFSIEQRGAYGNIKKDTFQIVAKTMFSYKETFAKKNSANELEEKWLNIIIEKDRNFFKSQLLDEFANFFNENNYSNYIAFVIDFEKHLVRFNPNIDFNQIIDEILVLELFMKNIGRNYISSTNCLSGDRLDLFVNCSYDSYYDFPLSPENLSLTTHFEYDKISFGNYIITLNWSWCINHVINSNIEKEFQDVEIVKVKLCDLLRYSQNYINLRKGIKNHYFRDFLHLYEGVVPIVPAYFHFTTQQSIFLSEQNKILGEGSKKNKDNPCSPFYLFLGDKFKLSGKFLNYCSTLYHEKFFAIDNIYKSSILIPLPFWEISRIQLVMFKQYVLADDAKYWESRMQDDAFYAFDDENYSSNENFDQEDTSDHDVNTDKEYKEFLREIIELPTKPDLDDFLDVKDFLDPHEDLC